MILEVAVLYVSPHLQTTFETDFATAGQYISAAKGYQRHSLSKCLEEDNKYILLVEWQTLEDHTFGFRQSGDYQLWKRLLHHYYFPFPVVEHYVSVIENRK